MALGSRGVAVLTTSSSEPTSLFRRPGSWTPRGPALWLKRVTSRCRVSAIRRVLHRHPEGERWIGRLPGGATGLPVPSAPSADVPQGVADGTSVRICPRR